ncbi:hypothetical protein AAG906_010705 [Vitis piasezkii]
MDTATWVLNSFLYISAAPQQCFELVGKNDEKHEGGSGAGGCSLSMHLGNNHMASADTSPSECKEERDLLVNACRPVLYFRSPSADCCQRVRVSHVECVCPTSVPRPPPSLEAKALVLHTWLRKLKGGRTVPRKFKWSITTP